MISLRDAVARRTAIAAQARELGLQLEITAAIDGRRGLPPQYEAMIDRAGARRALGCAMTDGEWACALSHRALYARILAQGLPGAVILEDDAVLGPAFAAFIRGGGYLAGDFIQMDHMTGRIWPRTLRPWSADIALAALAMNAGLATGYAVSAAGARFLLERTTPLRGRADWPCDLAPLHPLATLPRIVGHPLPENDLSSLESARRLGRPSAAWRLSRRLTAGYWRRWLRKRLSRQIS